MSESDQNIEENGKRSSKFTTSHKFYFYLAGLSGLLVFIGISAWWDLTFGEFDFKAFLSEVFILVAIALGAMLLSDLLSQESYMNKTFGVYNIARNEYDEIYKQVSGLLIYFSQWYFWYRDQETKRKRAGYLTLHDISGVEAKKIVSFATISDIKLMRECEKYYVKVLPNGKKIPFKKVETDEQQTAIERVLSGREDVKNSAYSKYLFTEDESEVNMSVLERQEFIEKRRKQSKKRSYIMRIITVVVVSALMAALAPANDEEIAQRNRWWIFVKRLSVFATSFISGWLAGSTDVTAKAAMIKDKTKILISFKDCYDKKLWLPKTEEELDQEAIDEWERGAATPSKENENAI